MKKIRLLLTGLVLGLLFTGCATLDTSGSWGPSWETRLWRQEMDKRPASSRFKSMIPPIQIPEDNPYQEDTFRDWLKGTFR